MAKTEYTTSTGVVVTFGGSVIPRVYSLAVSGPSGDNKGRGVYWTDSAGGATLSCFGTYPLNAWATFGVLSVVGGGSNFTADAVLDSHETEYELNGLTRTKLGFKFIQ